MATATDGVLINLAPTTDAVPEPLTIAPSPPWVSAVTHKTGAPCVINLPAPLSGGSEVGLLVQRNGAQLVSIQPLVGAPTYPAIYFGATTPSAANWSIAYVGGTLELQESTTENSSISLGAGVLTIGAYGTGGLDIEGIATTTTQSVSTTGLATLSALGVYSFLPITIGGVPYQLVLSK